MGGPVSAQFVFFGPFRFDLDTLELWRGEEPVPLAPKPSAALGLLVSQAGRLVTRDEIQAHVWGETVIEFDQALNTCVRHIRRALEDRPQKAKYVQTVPRRGYRFCAELTFSDESESVSAPPNRLRLRWLALLAVLLLPLVMMKGTDPRPPRIAVLPFTSLSEEASGHVMAKGIREEIASTLASFDPEDLLVVAQTSTTYWASQEVSLASIADALDLSYVIEGSVAVDSTGITRVTARLVHLPSETTVWSNQLGPQGFSGRIADAVAAAVTVDGGPKPGPSYAPNPSVRKSYLLALELLSRESAEGTHTAIDLLETAVADEEHYIPAKAALAQAYARSGATVAAWRLVAEVLEADPDNAQVLEVQARLAARDWDLKTADESAARSVRLSPGSSRLRHSRAYVLALQGRHAEAAGEMAFALDLDPVSPAVHGDSGRFSLWAEDWTDARLACEEATQFATDPGRVQATRCILEASIGMGDQVRAARAAAELLRLSGVPAMHDRLVGAGSTEVALDAFWSWAIAPGNLATALGSEGLYDSARALAYAGDMEAALAHLSAAVDQRAPRALRMSFDPAFRTMREVPRFQQLLRTLNSQVTHTEASTE